MKEGFLLKKFNEIGDKHPKFDLDQAFYFEYCKLYIDTIKIAA